MIVMALIPVIGVFLLMLLCVVVFNRRAARIAAAKVSLQSRAADTVNRDAENDQNLVDSILRGTAIDQAIAQHLKVRAQLLAGANPCEPANWTTEQFEAWKRQELEQAVAEANGRLTVPAVAGALFIVTACTVAVAVLYSSHAPVQQIQHPLTASSEPSGESAEPEPLQGLNNLQLPPIALPDSTDVEHPALPDDIPAAVPQSSKNPNFSEREGQE